MTPITEMKYRTQWLSPPWTVPQEPVSYQDLLASVIKYSWSFYHVQQQPPCFEIVDQEKSS